MTLFPKILDLLLYWNNKLTRRLKILKRNYSPKYIDIMGLLEKINRLT